MPHKNRSLMVSIYLLTTIITVNLCAQFQQFDTQNQPSSNWIRCIHEDNHGFMWFGTMQGLNRFDGKYYQNFFPVLANGAVLDSTGVNCIYPKNHHELYVGTDHGLFEFHRNSGKFNHISQIGELPVNDVLILDNGDLWVGTTTGVTIFDAHENITEINLQDVIKNRPDWLSNFVHRIFKDSDNNIWIGTRTNLIRTNEERNDWTLIEFDTTQGDLAVYDVMAIVEDHEHSVWCGTARNGLFLIEKNPKGFRAKQMAEGNIISLLIDSKNNIWLAKGQAQGLETIPTQKLKQTPGTTGVRYYSQPNVIGTLSDDSIFSVYEDSNQNIWVGTFGKGINLLPSSTKKFTTFQVNKMDPNSIDNNLINTFHEDSDYLWIGSEGGLERLDKSSGEIKSFNDFLPPEGIGKFPVFAIEEQSGTDRLWFGTWSGGLIAYDTQTNKFQQYLPQDNEGSLSSDNIFSVLDDQQGSLWLGTIGGGLNRLDLNSMEFSQFNPPALKLRPSIPEVALYQKDQLLVTDYADLAIINLTTEEVTVVPHQIAADGTKGGAIYDIFIDSQQTIWIATGSGLEIFDIVQQRFIPIHPKSLDIPLCVYAVEEDNEGHLWLSTSNGIVKFIDGIKIPSNPIFLYTDENEGIAGNVGKERSISISENGILNVGSTQGFTRFDPSSIFFNTRKAAIYISRISYLNSKPNEASEFLELEDFPRSDKTLELSYKQNYIRFNFAILNFINSEKNQYQYRLLGFDAGWISSGNHNQVTYTHLPPGRYKFEVRGGNNDGVPTANTASVSFKINPPWWERTSFRILVVTLATLILIYLVSRKILADKALNQKLQKKVDERTLELVAANEQLDNRRVLIERQNLELEFQKTHLEEMVNERTQKLSEALDKAEESDRLKSSFLANLTHEIRTPMNAILGFSHLLLDEDTDEQESKEYSKLIEEHGTKLVSIVDDILDIAMIHANQLKINKSDFSLNEFFENLYRQSKIYESDEVTLELVIPDSDFYINGDPFRVKQVLQNLLTNAFKFTPNGKVYLGYKTNESHATLFVEDTGIGIDKQKIDSIFDHFYKIEESKTKLYPGTGIGLSLSKNLLKLHNTKIEVRSEKNAGSLFSFQLPLVNHH